MSRASKVRRMRRVGRVRRVVVVVGASSGMGREVARAFAARGDDVVLAARSRSSLEEVAQECRDLGGRPLVVVTDVRDEDAVQALADRAVRECGHIDVWVHAAAVWSYGLFEDTPPEIFREVVDTTFLGQVHGARAVVPHFRARGGGVLISIASLYGRLSAPYVAPYVAAKWALVGFTRSLRQELLDAPGIAVCTVLPGTVDTPIYRHAANYTGRQIRPLPPVVAPERVARVVVGLSDRPRAEVVVGRTLGTAVVLQQVAPRLYDRLVVPLVRGLTLRGPEGVPPHEGTVVEPDPGTNRSRDGWRAHDGRVLVHAGGVTTLAGAVLAAGVAVVRRRR